MRPLFTPEELVALRAVDAELDAKPVSIREYRESDERDKRIKALNASREMAELNRRRERDRVRKKSNPEGRAASDREWRKNHPDAARKHYLANREYRLQWQREYRARKRAEKKAQAGEEREVRPRCHQKPEGNRTARSRSF